MNILPDQPHINEIRKRLWCGLEYGQASVMIGAGFSVNAQKNVLNSPNFPLWGDLKRLFCEDLYPGKNPKDISSDALSLASEYEATFGREGLDRFLIKVIPNNQHDPGYLHKLLMSLPWSDVYTTNYDTLLERTRKFIHDRKYDLIHTPADIPGKDKPRIVKLHGSFPSHRPFIVTEEDYSTYPSQFAPFVNMVQQSIMENIFCLIGFSGEDPNFLNWIGWVRDNLGQSMPTIYLCGLFDYLSEGKKQVLRQKQIITIDMSPLFPKAEWNTERHPKALEWFLLNLMYGEPSDVSEWGIKEDFRPKSLEWKPSFGIPPIPDNPFEKSNHDLNNDDPMSRNLYEQISDYQIKELEKIRKLWKQQRTNYPGWIICPKLNRDYLWRETQKWLNLALQGSQKMNPFKALLLIWQKWMTSPPNPLSCKERGNYFYYLVTLDRKDLPLPW